MNNIFKKQNNSPTPADIAAWEAQYGELCKWEADNNRVAYLRMPTQKQVAKLIKKSTKLSGYFDVMKFLKLTFIDVFLGGCKELVNDKKELIKLKELWQM